MTCLEHFDLNLIQEYSKQSEALIPQTGLALMGFSRYCPSSLDLTNFVVRSRRGAMRELSLAGSLESGNLEIQESRNLEIWNPPKQKNTYYYLRVDPTQREYES